LCLPQSGACEEVVVGVTFPQRVVPVEVPRPYHVCGMGVPTHCLCLVSIPPFYCVQASSVLTVIVDVEYLNFAKVGMEFDGGDVWGVDSEVCPACRIYSGADKDHCSGHGGIFSAFCDGVDYFPSGQSAGVVEEV
jgi:hypothetical protein